MKKLNQFLSFTIFVFLLTSLLFTGCSEEKREITKPTIMILGSRHLANPGIDAFNYKMDDVLAPKRQSEIKQLVQQIKEYNPTKIAIEQDPSRNAEINTNYQGYLAATYKLQRWEIDQIGFRLAKLMEHSEVYCVDYSSDQDPFIPEDFDFNLIDYVKFAKEHNQEHLLPSVEGNTDPNVEFHEEENGRVWIEPKKYESLIDMYIRDNKPEGRRTEHQLYLQVAKVGLKDQYPGANWVGYYWYTRNLKIFVNLTRITESSEDRILLIIGAGHVYLVQHFLEASGDYNLESPLKYLKTEDSN